MTTLTNPHAERLGQCEPSPAAFAPDVSASQPVTVITPPRGWQFLNLRELWQFRELLYFLVWRDVKVRYKQTLLGAAWALLQPAMMMVVFTIFFGRLAGVPSGDVPYPLFVYAGLLPWTFFAAAVGHAGNSVIMSESLITKIYFPRLAVPFAAVGVGVVDSIVACSLLFVLLPIFGVIPGPNLLLLPLVFAVIAILSAGVGTLLAALNVTYRDFRYVVPFSLQLWMFATPTIYMAPSVADGPISTLLACNPMTTLVAAYRAAALGGPFPWGPFSLSSAGAGLVLVLGCCYFRKVEDRFADII
jgi:lipopolysaccharide transport system permease protein